MHAQEIRHRAETAPPEALPVIAVALWQAYSAGWIPEAEAHVLSALIDARRAAPCPPGLFQKPPQALAEAIRKAVGSRPRSSASLARRRTWAASGRLPPSIACRFTPGEQAVLSVVAAKVCEWGDCRLPIDALAALAGVGRTLAKNAIREAVLQGMLTREERRVPGRRNEPNIVRIAAREWLAWLQMKRRPAPPSLSPWPGDASPGPSRGGGVRSATPTGTSVADSGESRRSAPSQGCRGAALDPDWSANPRIRAGGGTPRAMR